MRIRHSTQPPLDNNQYSVPTARVSANLLVKLSLEFDKHPSMVLAKLFSLMSINAEPGTNFSTLPEIVYYLLEVINPCAIKKKS